MGKSSDTKKGRKRDDDDATSSKKVKAVPVETPKTDSKDAGKKKKRLPTDITEAAAKLAKQAASVAHVEESRLRNTEEEFPRGGFIEHDAQRIADEMNEAEERQQKKGTKGGKSKTAEKRKKYEETKAAKKEPKKEVVKRVKEASGVELLKFKKLSVGMGLLGAVREIGDLDILVSLPNNLVGSISMTYISDPVERLATAASNDDDEDSPSTSNAEMPDLHKFFRVGQLVRTVVTELDAAGATKKIKLSTNPSLVNSGIPASAITQGMHISAVVESSEDKGFVLSFGSDIDMKGFLSKENAAAYVTAKGTSEGDESPSLNVGEVVDCVVEKVKGRIAQLITKRSSVASNMTLVAGLPMQAVKAGILVEGIVTKSNEGGAIVDISGYTATIDRFHTAVPGTAAPAAGSKIKARVIWVDSGAQRLGLSLRPDLIAGGRLPTAENLIGTIVDTEVKRVDPTVGLLVTIGDAGDAFGFVHISRAADDRVENLSKLFSVGDTNKGRVIGSSLLDGLLMVSLAPGVVNAKWLTYADIKPASLITGVIASVETFGVVVQLAPNIRGLIPPLHLADVKVRDPSVRFKAGKAIECRVLSVDIAKKRLYLTHKKTLLKSPHAFLTNYEDAKPGLVTHGYVTNVKDFGCMVGFYNHVKGVAAVGELGPIMGAPGESFVSGMVVQCRVLASDPVTQRLALSFVMSEDETPTSLSLKDVSIGEFVKGRVQARLPTGFLIALAPLANAVLPFNHLTDHPSLIEQLSDRIIVGSVLSDLLVLNKDNETHRCMVSRKKTLIDAARAGNLPSKLAQIKEGTVIPGYVKRIETFGVIVGFLGGLTALCAKANVSDAFVNDPKTHVTVGQTVLCSVTEIDNDKSRFYVSLRDSQVNASMINYASSYISDRVFETTWDGPSIGSVVEAIMDERKDYGAVFTISKTVTGFSVTHQLEGAKLVEGKASAGVVLDVDRGHSVADLSFRPALVKAAQETKKHNVPKVDETVKAKIELVKAQYLILSLPAHPGVLAFAPVSTLNTTRDAFALYKADDTVNVKVVKNGVAGDPDRRLVVQLSDAKTPKKGGEKKEKVGKSGFFDSSLTSIADLKVGGSYKVKVTLVGVSQLVVAFNREKEYRQGRIHVMDIKADGEQYPLEQYKVGDLVDATILEIPENETEQVRMAVGRTSATEVTIEDGTRVQGVVEKVEDGNLWVWLAPNIRGRFSSLDLTTDENVMKNLEAHYKRGQRVKGVVLESQKHGATRMAYLALKMPSIPKKGDVILGRVSRVLNDGIIVQLPGHLYGKVHVTDLSDVFVARPLKGFKIGQYVRVCVLDVYESTTAAVKEENSDDEKDATPTKKMCIDLSMRPSRVEKNADDSAFPEINDFEDLSVGQVVQGYVKRIVENKGCFVSLSRSIDGRVLIADISDNFIKDIIRAYPPLTPVTGRITAVDAEHKRVSLSLKPSVVSDKPRITLENIKVGMRVPGARIKQVQKYGLFLSIDNSSLTAFVHSSEISDKRLDLPALFSVGDRVRAVIVKVDADAKKIWASVIPDKVAQASGGDSDDEDEDEDEEDDVEVSSKVRADDDNSDEYDSEELDELLEKGQESDSDSDAPARKRVAVSKGESSDEEDEMDAEPTTSQKRSAASVDAQADKAGWQSFSFFKKSADSEEEESGDESSDEEPAVALKGKHAAKKQAVKEESDSDSGSESESESEGEDTKSSKAKRARKREREERERKVDKAEEAQAAGSAPQVADDYEKLLMGSPSSSILWIRYMAFHLSRAAVDVARQTAERALKTINYREEGEKRNVWVAYMNLENSRGTQESLSAVFARACTFNDPKKMHMQLATILEASGKTEQCDALYASMANKFKDSAKIWMQYGAFKTRAGDMDGMRRLLPRALAVVPKRKHLKIITRFGQYEFKFGDADRGRTIFEGIVTNNPKRVDLWSVYLDMEIRAGNVDIIRRLFERVINLKISAKKMKFFFKRYLEFESAKGDEESVEHVKRKAMEYVESRAS